MFSPWNGSAAGLMNRGLQWGDTQSSGPAPFDPSQISGLIAWYQADNGLYTDTGATTPVASDGDLVACWKDLSSNANNVTQSNGANRPAYKVNIQNGKPAVLFSQASGNILSKTNNSSLNPTNMSWFLVATPTGVGNGGSGADCSPFFKQGTGSSFMWGATWGAITNVHYTMYAIDTTAGGETNCSNAGTTNNSVWTLFEHTFDGTTGIIYTNAVQTGSQANAGNMTSGTGTMTIGGVPSTFFGGNFMQGYIGEIIFYNSALSTANRQLVETYLNARWAVY